MKILIVNKFLHPNGGSETYIFKLGEALMAMGHEVQYFGMDHENRIVGNSAESYTMNMDFHIGKFQKLLYPFKILYSFEARKKIRRVIEDFKPDIVHLNNFNYQLTPSIIYEMKAHHLPIVFTAHDLQLVCPNHLMMYGKTGELCDLCQTKGSRACFQGRCIHGSAAKSLLGTVENWLYKRWKAYEKIDVILCPSRYVEEKLSKNKKLAGRTRVLRNFISDLDVEQYAADKKEFVIYFGRYSKEKGVQTLVEACKELPEIPFVFAGKGEFEEQVNNTANIENKGFLSGDDLYGLIASARFSICPSECPDNCPFSVMESIKLGTPVIGADIGGIPELVEDGVNGILFESGNKEELKSAIRRLWENREENAVYIQGCAGIEYDNCRKYSKKLITIYKELV